MALIAFFAACRTEKAPGYTATVISVDPQALSFPASGGTEKIRISSDGGWSFEGPDWIVSYPSSGYGDCVVEITVDHLAKE